jgi:hypothetical protein
MRDMDLLDYSTTLSPIDLRTVPSSDLAREMARRSAPAVAAQRILRPCLWCGLPFGARDLRNHLPECIHNPKRRAARKAKNIHGK